MTGHMQNVCSVRLPVYRVGSIEIPLLLLAPVRFTVSSRQERNEHSGTGSVPKNGACPHFHFQHGSGEAFIPESHLGILAIGMVHPPFDTDIER